MLHAATDYNNFRISNTCTHHPARSLSPPVSAAFLLYIKCDTPKKGDSGRAKVVLDLYPAKNGLLGEDVITVELTFLKDCASFCWMQDDDAGREGQTGLQCSKYKVVSDTN